MIFLYFTIFTIVLSAIVFWIENKVISYTSGILYVLSQIFLSVYAYLHPGQSDSGYFIFDNLGILLNILLVVITFPVLFHSRFYLVRHVSDLNARGKFLALLFILESAISGIYFTDNFIIMWVCFEITTIVITFLTYHERYPAALEASWKYLFISSIGITFAFLGLLFLSVQNVKGNEVSLSYDHLLVAASAIDPFFIKAAFLLLLTGYSVKMNIFPLYAATVDAKTVAPFPVNAITSTAMINGGFVAIFRIFSIISKTNSFEWARHVMLITGIFSLFIVAVQLFRVKRFKRMFAFSTMEHMALIIIALSLGKPGYYAALLHLVFHTLAKTGMFLHFGIIRASYQTGWIKNTGLYFQNNGFGAIIYILGLLTITAIPPSGMFFSEYLIFKALFLTGNFFIAVLMLLLLTVIIYILFKYSIQLLYGIPAETFQPEKAIINKYEPVSQIILFGGIIYLAYFPPVLFTDLINAIINQLS